MTQVYKNDKNKSNSSKNIIIFEYSKYSGNVDNDDRYTGFGKLKKKSFSFNRSQNKIEIETDFEYVGEFNYGEFSGKGMLKQFSRSEGYTSEYNGEFRNDKMNGYGVIKYSDNFFITKYEGFFINDMKFYLYGIVYFKSGDIYEGFFDDKFQKDYLGLYFHGNNSQIASPVSDNYFGYFTKDIKDGFGRFASVNSVRVFSGSYVNGEKQGFFSLIGEEKVEKEGYDELMTYDLNNDEIERNIVSLATRKNEGIHSERKRKKKKQRRKDILGVPIIKQKKMYFFFENNDILDRSDKPFDTI